MDAAAGRAVERIALRIETQDLRDAFDGFWLADYPDETANLFGR